MNDEAAAIRTVLLRLSNSDDKVVAALAEALIPTCELREWNPLTHETRDARERISALAVDFACNSTNASTIAAALVKIDCAISKANATPPPFATQLTPLALECTLRAAMARYRKESEWDISSRSPVIRIDHRTVLAAPIGDLNSDELEAVIDRIFMEIGKQKTKRVLLSLAGLKSSEEASKCITALREDLSAQKIRLELLEKEPF